VTYQDGFEEVPLDVESGESEDDIVGRLGAQRANITSADWTIETIVNQLIKGRIELNPSFQRRAAWTTRTKSQFIESAILNYPIPQIVLAELEERPGQFIVIDGKQRLLALRQFYAGLEADKYSGFESFRLTTVPILQAIKRYDAQRLLTDRPQFYDAFENHTIRTVVIRNWQSEDFLYTLFLRLNTGNVPLSPQELRQALAPGGFVSYVDYTSGNSSGLRRLLNNDAPDRRMVDAELLTRLIGLNTKAVPYRGNLKDFLDTTCRHYNKNWSRSESRVMALVDEMEAAIECAYEIFEAPCRKWNPQTDRPERAFNRALFDVQIGSLLGGEEIRDASRKHAKALNSGFNRLCTEDENFISAISSTTKTVDAVQRRFTSWYRVVRRTTKILPEWPAALSRVS
jgi:hypothetical protein